jgi:sec-independent protein translocase protein TatC
MRSGISFKPAYPFISLVPREGAVTSLVFLAPAEAFWVHLKISLITGLILALPVIFHQVWKFISPGLLQREKKYAIPFIIIATGLFFFGTVFCFVIVLPFAMKFLLSYKTASLTPMISIERYIDFCLKFILAFGAVFELPVIIVFLTRTGIVSYQTLAKNRKYAVLLAFVTAAILTPTPDAFNQTLMAVPIIFLYEGGLLVSKLFVKRKSEDDKRQEH